jgi:hypothetical protein
MMGLQNRMKTTGSQTALGRDPVATLAQGCGGTLRQHNARAQLQGSARSSEL